MNLSFLITRSRTKGWALAAVVTVCAFPFATVLAFSQQHIPPAVEPSHCSVAQPRELANEKFTRNGGRRGRDKVITEKDYLTVKDVSQGRNLSGYDRLVLSDPAMFVIQRDQSQVLAHARTFLYEHWRNRKPAYLIFTGRSVDAMSTSHIFIEQDSAGRWRVSWRIVRHTGEVDDLPTSYSIEWVVPTEYGKPGRPVPSGRTPDPVSDYLQFRGKCRDSVMSF